MKTDLRSFCVAAAFLISSSAVFAADRLVPGQYPTIQAAIDAAVDDDIIIVAPDSYYQNIDFGGKSITVTSTNPNDPNIVAATVINANGSGTVVTFPDIGDPNCVLTGFTITGGDTLGQGGGICCRIGTITINNCIITGNSAVQGAGIYNDQGDLTLTGCTFSSNSASSRGGGIANEGRDLTLTDCAFSGNSTDFYGGGIFSQTGGLTLTDCTFSENMALGQHGGGIYSVDGELTLTACTFTGNSAANEGGGVAADYNSVTLTGCTFSSNSANLGGGINNAHWGATMTNCMFGSNSATNGAGIHTNYLYLGDLTLRNCTFSDNMADNHGGAVHNRAGGNLMLSNCILWGNTANEGPQIALEQSGTVSLSYSCLQGGHYDVYAPSAVVDWLVGSIDSDPCFADEAGGDYHLRCAAGRWDANVNNWVADDSNSPCIDAGDPNSDWTAELWPHGKRINMGVFGGTPQAGMSGSDAGNIADLDQNGLVNGVDLKLITDKWLYQQLLLSEDLDRDGFLDAKDFALFADNWPWEQ